MIWEYPGLRIYCEKALTIIQPMSWKSDSNVADDQASIWEQIFWTPIAVNQKAEFWHESLRISNSSGDSQSYNCKLPHSRHAADAKNTGPAIRYTYPCTLNAFKFCQEKHPQFIDFSSKIKFTEHFISRRNSLDIGYLLLSKAGHQQICSDWKIPILAEVGSSLMGSVN